MQRVSIDRLSFDAPDAWTEQRREERVVVLQAPDGKQQATVSTIVHRRDISFGEFEVMCGHRMESERAQFEDGFVDVTGPKDQGGSHMAHFSGADRQSGRVFSGYLLVVEEVLVTVYLEGFGLEPREHLENFQALVRSCEVG